MKYSKKDLIHPIPSSRWHHVWSGFIGDNLAILALIVFFFTALLRSLAPVGSAV